MPGAWFVYIIEAENGALYTGISTDPDRRLAEHRASQKGARFFRFTRPVRCVYRERVQGRPAALRREAEIKRLSRAAKLALAHAKKATARKRAQKRRGPRRKKPARGKTPAAAKKKMKKKAPAGKPGPPVVRKKTRAARKSPGDGFE